MQQDLQRAILPAMAKIRWKTEMKLQRSSAGQENKPPLGINHGAPYQDAGLPSDELAGVSVQSAVI